MTPQSYATPESHAEATRNRCTFKGVLCIVLPVTPRVATSLWYRMHVMLYPGAHLSNVCSLKAISTSPLLWPVWRRSNPKRFKSRIWCLSTRARLRNPRQHFKVMISIAKNVRMEPAKYEGLTPSRTEVMRENRNSKKNFFLELGVRLRQSL